MKLILIIVNFFLLSQILAQNTAEIILSIDNESVTKREFISFYKKNNINSYNLDRNTLKLQLNKFIAFKLKVKEAKNIGLNNTEQYESELRLYKEQLSKSYLADKKIINKLVKEAYNRLLIEIRVKHILVKLSPYSSKEDSVIAYNKAIKIKKRIVDGENFNNVAKETSDDPTAVENGGDLWYVSAFDLPYDLENIIYKSKQKSLIGPVKTKQGYHLIKIIKRRANFGSYKVAHILLNRVENDSLKLVKSKIDSIYRIVKLKNNFSELSAKYSEDKSANLNGGVLPWFSTNQMPHAFEEATNKLLKNGDVSKPVKTKNAWHIIKRINKKELPSFEKIKEQIEHEVKSTDRYDLCEKSLLKKIKKENKIKEYYSIYEIKSTIDSSIFKGKWEIPDSIVFDKVLFSVNNIKFLQSDFVNYLYKNQKPVYGSSTDGYVNQKYIEFRNDILIKLEEKKLELKYQEYRNLINEFSESLLHRYFIDKEILQKCDNNDDELKKYYFLNKEKYNNTFYSNFSFLQYENSVDITKLEKLFEKYRNKGYANEELAKKLEKNLKSNIKFLKNEKFTEGNDKIADVVFAKFKQKQINKKTKYVFLKEKNLVVCIKSKIERFIKPFDNVKDKIMPDYQLDREAELIEKLKSKYKVEINENIFESLLN